MKYFYTILTNYGKTALSEALATQKPLEVPYMGAGDGGGTYYEPTEAQTNLRNELWRGELNDLRADDALQGQVIAEAIIPMDEEGDWTVREIGLFDKLGGLIAVGKYPEMYIPSASSGAKTQTHISIIIKVDNSAALQLIVDHSQVLASKLYLAQENAKLRNELNAALAANQAQMKEMNTQTAKIQRAQLTNNHILNTSQLELIAHRGFARQFPQNSLFGFSMALRAGATSLECDVQSSSDGVLYVFHDLDVSALTNGSGLFREKSSEEIDQLRYTNIQGSIYKDLHIPRFQDVLFLCKERGVKIYAEFSDHMTDANILEYLRLITYYDAESNVSTQCFNNDKLLFVRQHNKNLELGFLRPTAADYEAMLPILQANAPAMFLMEMNSFLSDSTIAKKCRNANVGLAVWTVQNATDLARVMRAGCHRVVSDVSLITKKRG